MTIETLKESWVDIPEHHIHISEFFTQMVNADPELDEHRTFIENNIYGMGERAFQWFWKVMVDEMPDGFKFLEIGVHKAQVLSLVRLLANRTGKKAEIFGITPMDGTGTGWTEDDYEGDIARIHERFGLDQPVLYKGLSMDREASIFAMQHKMFDVLYVDGDHSYNGALFDIGSYSTFVKIGGYLVIDDACCDLNFPPSGFFTGIETVTNATLYYMKRCGSSWEFQFNVVHLRIYKRI